MKRIALFAHYDADDAVKRYIVYHLRRLREHCDEVVFVSTAKLGEAELAKVRPFCSRVTLKDNVGFDFAMWQHALAGVDVKAWDEVVLTNSSVLGPMPSLQGAFDRMAGEACDFWGMTGNHEHSWHLQSYFLVFRRRLLDSPEFARFWSSVLPYREKWHVIRAYEIGLTGYFVENGFVGKAFADLERPRKLGPLPLPRRRRPRNPTCFYPLELIDEGMPYVKVELLRDNPARLRLGPVRRAMARLGYDLGLVEFDSRKR